MAKVEGRLFRGLALVRSRGLLRKSVPRLVRGKRLFSFRGGRHAPYSLELSCAALAVFCAGLIRGATGFGFSMICIVLLTLLLPPAHHRAGDRALGDRGQCWAFALCLQGSGLESPAPSGAGRGLGHAAGRVLFGLGARRADDRGHQYGRVGPDGHAFFRLQAAAAAGPLGSLRGGRAHRADQRRVGPTAGRRSFSFFCPALPAWR